MEVDAVTESKKQEEQLQRLKQPLFHLGPLADNQVLISRKKHPRIYLERIHKVFFSLEQEDVFLQAVGASVQLAVDIALQVQTKYSGITTEVETFTMPITDEIVDGNDGTVVGEEHRFNSGILIKLTKLKDL